MKDNNKYTITNLTSEQLNVMMVALDTYCRLGLLQFENIIPKDIQWNDNFGYIKNQELINMHLSEVRSLIVEGLDNYKNMPRNRQWSFGIGSSETSKTSQISYELYCDIKNYIILKDGGIPRGKLNLTNLGNIKIEDMDSRLEKIINIVNKIKQTSNDKL